MHNHTFGKGAMALSWAFAIRVVVHFVIVYDWKNRIVHNHKTVYCYTSLSWGFAF